VIVRYNESHAQFAHHSIVKSQEHRRAINETSSLVWTCRHLDNHTRAWLISGAEFVSDGIWQ